MSQRDTMQPYLEALDAELQAATSGGRQCRFSRQFVDDLLAAVADVLDDLDTASAPHDERLQEARELLRHIGHALLGPGDRDPKDIVTAAAAIRDAARVSQDVDINVLLQEISNGAAVYSRPEYGPKSRWQYLRDQIDELTLQLQEERDTRAAAERTVEAIRADLEQEQAKTVELQESLDREVMRGTRTGLDVIRLRDTLTGAEWNPDSSRWTLTDDQRTAALDG